MIAHIVLFTPKPGVSEDDIRSFATLLVDTCSSIAEVKRARVGRTLSVDAGYSRDFGYKTYQYSAVLEFESQEGLVRYLTNPLHGHLGRRFWELCESTVVMESACVDPREAGSIDFLVKEQNTSS